MLAHSSRSSERRFSAVRTSRAENGSSKADALAHSTGKLLGIGAFEAVEANGVEHFHAAGAALVGRDAASLEGGFDVFKDGKPGEEGEALEDDGDVDFSAGDWLLVPVDLAGGGCGEAGEHAQHGGFAGTGRAEKGEDFAGDYGKVGGGDDLNAVFAGLGVVFLHLFGANDGFDRWNLRVIGDGGAAHARVSG